MLDQKLLTFANEEYAGPLRWSSRLQTQIDTFGTCLLEARAVEYEIWTSGFTY